MLQRICIFVLVLAAASASVARAATVYEQALPVDWLDKRFANCSPCSFKDVPATLLGSRMFASFELGASTVLDGARFAAVNSPSGFLGDFSISIWESPFSVEGPIVQTLLGKGSYSLFSGSSGYLNVALPDWSLAPGHYWLSVFGENGAGFQWGGLETGGDDRRYTNGELFLKSDSTQPPSYLLGFSLYGTAPVATPIGGTLPLLLSALAGLFFVRRRPAA
jgi:hypothetical protein